MPLAAETLLAAPGGTVTLAASKYNGRSVTVGSLVAAITVRAIADGAGVVCASAATARAAAPKSANPIVLKRIVISLVKNSRGTLNADSDAALMNSRPTPRYAF